MFYKDIDGYAIKIGKKHKDDVSIEDILIYINDPRKKGNNNILTAKQGKMYITKDQKFMVLELFNGKRYQELVNDKEYPERMQHNTMTFDSYKMAIDLTELQFNRTKKELFKEDHRMLNVDELDTRIDSLSGVIVKRNGNLARYLEPHFPLPPDSLIVPDISIEERISELRERAKRQYTKATITVDTNLIATKALGKHRSQTA